MEWILLTTSCVICTLQCVITTTGERPKKTTWPLLSGDDHHYVHDCTHYKFNWQFWRFTRWFTSWKITLPSSWACVTSVKFQTKNCFCFAKNGAGKFRMHHGNVYNAVEHSKSFLRFFFFFFFVCFFWGWGLSNLFQLRDFWLLVSNRHVFFLIANGQIPTTPPIWWNHFPVDKSIHFCSSYPHKLLVRCLLLSNLETPAARSIRN